MIPSLDTYVFGKLKDNLKAILTTPEVLEVALGGMDSKARENFIKTYGGKNPKQEVQVSYHFPGAKEQFNARYVVQLGPSNEVNRSLGMADAVFSYREGEERNDIGVVKHNELEDYLYIETEYLIGDLYSTDSIDFAKADDVRIQDNKVIFNRIGNESLVGLTTRVHYMSKVAPDDGEDPSGIQKGYTSRDIVEVTPLSNNMDTARCLDSILKVISIMMADSPEEQITYQLQTLRYGGMDNLVTELDSLLYGRPLTLEYTVNYTIDYDTIRRIKEINLKVVKRHD